MFHTSSACDKNFSAAANSRQYSQVSPASSQVMRKPEAHNLFGAAFGGWNTTGRTWFAARVSLSDCGAAKDGANSHRAKKRHDNSDFMHKFTSFTMRSDHSPAFSLTGENGRSAT
jgi:hypothetical protein